MGNLFTTGDELREQIRELEKKLKDEREKKIRELEKKLKEEQEKQIKKDRKNQIWDLLEDIRKRLGKFSPYRENEALRLVLVGSVRAGKSSLVNNILSALKGVLVHTAYVGNGYGHVTGKYTEYKVAMDDGMNQGGSHLVLCDTMGFDTQHPEDHVASVRAVLKGYCTQNQNMANEMTAERANKRQAVYIIFVADATQVDNAKDDRSQMIESIQMFAQIEQIPVCLFLTFCDDLDGAVVQNMDNIYKSAKVNRAINFAHLQFNGIPKARIYPIVNYTDQWKVEPQIRLLTLRALCDIVRDVESYMYDVVRDA